MVPKSNFDMFLEKAAEMVVTSSLDGKSYAASEKEVADYYSMSLIDYRLTRSAALKARRARQTFEIRYYKGTHPDATAAEIATALKLPEVQIKAVMDTK